MFGEFFANSLLTGKLAGISRKKGPFGVNFATNFPCGFRVLYPKFPAAPNREFFESQQGMFHAET
jgi:hypothetical protein